MPGSISQFKSSFSTDIARQNRFDVSIPVPLGLIPYRNLSKQLTFRCESAELPGRAVATSNMKIYGVEEKFPYMTSYNDISLTFVVSDDMKEKKFFDSWINWITPSYSYNVKYKSDYSVILRITQYDATLKSSYSADLIDAFPIAVNPLQLDWSSEGMHKLTVTFAYTNWRNNSLEALGMEFLESQISAGLNSISLNSNLGTDILNSSSIDPVAVAFPVPDRRTPPIVGLDDPF